MSADLNFNDLNYNFNFLKHKTFFKFTWEIKFCFFAPLLGEKRGKNFMVQKNVHSVDIYVEMNNSCLLCSLF